MLPYDKLVLSENLADYSPIKGCMVIKPYGFQIWKNIQKILGGKINERGHQDTYFPIFIPQNLFAKEAQHIEGFSPECAVVTYGGVKKLDKPLIV